MSYDEVPPRDAHLRIQAGARCIDVRSEPEFDGGHPAGAFNIPILFMGPAGAAPNPRFVEVVRAHFRADEDLVLSCRSGGRSARACEVLRAAGFSGVLTNVAGGFEGAPGVRGWAAEGLPAEVAAPGRRWDDLK